MRRALKNDTDAILTKEQAKEWAQRLNNKGGTYYLAHGEYARPDYKAVRCRDGWKVKKTSHFYSGTIVNGVMVFGDVSGYLSKEAWCMDGEMYMNIETGSLDTYEGWWYYEQDDDGAYTGKQVNAVERGEVVAVEWDGEKWTERTP